MFKFIKNQFTNMRIKTLAYIASFAIFCILISVTFSAIYLTDKANNLEAAWEKFDKKAVTRINLLKEIQSKMGYGGMVHNFKNYILRKDPKLLINFYKSTREIDILIAQYKNLGIRPVEEESLSIIKKTKDKYKTMAILAEKLVKQNKSPLEIDPLVKVDDTEALTQITHLKNFIKNEHLQKSKAVEKLIHKQKHYIFYVSFFKSLTILCSLAIMFYLSYKRVTKPLLSINKAMKKIKNDNLNVEIPYINQKDEIGELAMSVQVFLSRTRELKIKESEIEIYVAQLQKKQKQLEQEIKNAQTADNANKMKSEFLATMSHEIRTPMNGIIGTAELMLANKLKPQQEEEVKVILNSAESLLEIINGILDFSKIEAGHVSLEDKKFNLTNLIDEVSQVVAPVIYHKNIEFITDIEPDVNQNLVGDPLRIKQVLTNLLGNAVKFTEKGFITVHIKKDSSTVPLEGFEALIFEVKDTGIGINSGTQNLIFEKFTQGDSSTTRTHGGTGLGLSISKELIKLMRGNIGLHSTQGKGSTFWFKLVLQEDRTDKQPKEEIKPFSKHKNIKAIILDSQQNHRDFLKKKLYELNIESTDTNIIQDAYSLLNANPNKFEFIFINIQNSHKNIRKKINYIKSIAPKVKVIILANPTTPSDMNDLYSNHNIDALIQKPVHLKNISNGLYKALNDEKENRKSYYKTELNENHGVHKGKKALLVEDNEINLTIGKNMLKMFGLEVDTAENGLEAIEAIKSENTKYDIIFMDCQMPVMDGYTAASQIKEIKQKENIEVAPIIALTANAMKGDYHKCINSGMDDYIPKPVHIDALNLLLDKWLSENPHPTQPIKQKKSNKEETESEEPVKALKEAHALLKTEFQALLDKFFHESEKHLENIIEGYTKHNAKLIEESAHKLKSSSLQVGAKLLSSVAEEIELNVKSHSDQQALFNEIETKLPYLKQSLKRSHESLKLFADNQANHVNSKETLN